MTDCTRTDIRDVLPDWVHGSLDDAAAADVAEHLTTCAACAAEAELLRSMRRVMVREPQIDLQRVAAAVVERTTSTRTPAQARTGWRTVVGGLAVAASVAFGVLLLRSDHERTGAVDPVARIGSADTSRDTAVHTEVPDDSSAGTRLPERDTAAAPPPPDRPPEPEMRLAVTEVPVSGGLSDLGVDQLEALLARLDDIEALPQTSPAPTLTTDLEVR